MSKLTPLDTMPKLGLGIRVLSPEESQNVDLGPLRALEGTWEAAPFQGWNLISVPGPLPDGFTFEVIPYKEILTFTPVVTAGNRGPVTVNSQADQQITGLMYEQKVISVCDSDLCKKMGFGAGTEIHAERGIFLYVQNFNSGFELARLSTIPHGNSVLALGKSFEGIANDNNFPLNTPSSPLPTLKGQPILDYGLKQFGTPQFPNFDQKIPNSALVNELGNKKITAMTTLVFSTDNGKNGGGILNIPFIQQNVDATNMTATFWIETIEGQDQPQLQYTQTIDLVFPPTGSLQPILWPHITVATLTKVS